LAGIFHSDFLYCLYRFYARTSRHYVGLDQYANANGADFLDGHTKRATRLSGPPN